MNMAQHKLERMQSYLQADPENISLLLDCAATARAVNDERAQYWCERVLNLSPENTNAAFLLGEIFLDHKNYERAAQQFSQLLNRGETGRAIRHNLALALLLQLQFAEAESVLAPVMTDDDIGPDTWALYGRLKYHLADTDRARELLEHCINIAPSHVEALGLLSLLCLESGDAVNAHAYSDRALRVDCNNHESLIVQAALSLGENDSSEARRRFSSLLQNYPDSWRVLFGQGLLELRDAEFLAAEHYLQRCLTIMPNYAQIQYTLGWTLLSQSKAEEAASLFRAALEMEASNDDFRASLVCAMIFNNQVDEAQAEMALIKDRNGAVAQWALALMTIGKQSVSGELEMKQVYQQALGKNGASLATLIRKLFDGLRKPAPVGRGSY